MNIPNPYFKDVPQYGDLVMEQIIVEYNYPLLSVLKDNANKRYLCMCFDTRGSQQWIIVPISDSNLIKLLTDRITLEFPFRKSESTAILAVRNYETKRESFQKILPKDIPDEDLPMPGEFLEAEEGEWNEYIATINSEWIERSAGVTVYCKSMPYIMKLLIKQPSDIFEQSKKVFEIGESYSSEYNRRVEYSMCAY